MQVPLACRRPLLYSPSAKGRCNQQRPLCTGRPCTSRPLPHTTVMASTQGSKHVWALDFDGVVCDSVGESSLTAWKAALRLWPDVFGSASAEQEKQRVLKQMHVVRPVIETGFENLIQIRCLLENIPTDDILSSWHTLLPQYMAKWGCTRQELLELFGGTRDDWIAEDFEGWLAPNEIYEGMDAALQHLQAQHELYIVTTKQARFTEAILSDKAHISSLSDRIFSTAETGHPKSDVLADLEKQHPGTEYHFVEDKLGTLEKVSKMRELEHWQLYLVDWGYNTAAERNKAAKNSRIKILDKSQLQATIG